MIAAPPAMEPACAGQGAAPALAACALAGHYAHQTHGKHHMLWFIPGLIALIVGAELLVRGASKLALSFGISPLVVGLTVVAFGTSAPELAVSVQSAWSGQVDIALGNVVGSNIFNVLFILGLSALIAPLLVHRQLIRQEVPMMVALSLLLWLLASDGGISRGDGLLLVSLLLAYTFLVIRQSRRESLAGAPLASELPPPVDGHAWDAHWLAQLLLVAAGMTLLVLGSNWLVEAAVTLARRLGMSEVVVGLTIVAAGTSLPEVATSIMAAVRGQRDIAVGNVVGSNIFNILAVLGISASIAPGDLLVPASLAGLRPASDGRRRRRLPAHLLYRPPDRALGRGAVPRLLRGLHHLPGAGRRRPRRAKRLLAGDGQLRPAAHRNHLDPARLASLAQGPQLTVMTRRDTPES
jgi:cation:H+ antiporter